MTLPTPPRYVVFPWEVMEEAYAPDKPRRALFSSFLRILALAWQSKYEKTPPMNEDELIEYLKLSRRQYFEQKADMELMTWLRSSHPVPGFVQFSFSRSFIAGVNTQPTREINAENRIDDEKNTETRTGNSLIGGGESLINLNTDSSTPIIKSGINAKNRTTGAIAFPSVVEILAQTPLLFDGAVVISKGLEAREPLDVLAWCAYAYSQRSKMSGPGGVVRNRLLENQKPPEWTKHQWAKTLPENFLEALRLIKFECDVCRQVFEHRADLESHQESHPLPAICEECSRKFVNLEALETHVTQVHTEPVCTQTADNSIEAPVQDGISARQAWQRVLEQLQADMPRASFEAWVQDAQPLRFDRNALTIAVRNEHVRGWLESRLISTIESLLLGILNREVSVVFMVATLVESE